MDKDIIINGKNIKGVKKTVGKYNKLPVEQRTAYNIWYDLMERKVTLISNDSFKQETYYSRIGGFIFKRYEDLSDIISDVYPCLGTANISMTMLKNVLSQYFA